MSFSGSSTLTFSNVEETYYKVYSIREDLLLVTPYPQNVHDFIEEYLDERIAKVPHIPLNTKVFFRGHVYLERVLL